MPSALRRLSTQHLHNALCRSERALIEDEFEQEHEDESRTANREPRTLLHPAPKR